MNNLTTTVGVKRIGSWMTRLVLLALILVGTGLSAVAAPQLKGFNFKDGQLFYPVTSDTIKVYYTEPVTKTYWSLQQDGVEVLSGTCTGKDMNQPYATIAMKTALGNALAAKTVKLGSASLVITKVEYDGDQVAENLGSGLWDITDAPLCNAMAPYPVPDGNTPPEIKENTTCNFQGPTGSFMGNQTQIKQVKARILQNGSVLKEEVIFNGSVSVSSGKYTYSATNKLGTDPVWNKIDAGMVEIQFYEVTYISPVDGEEKTLNVQPALPAKSATVGSGMYAQQYKGVAITYGEKKSAAKSNIVAESLEQYTGEILSYYPANGTDGVITYTSDIAIDPTALHAEFSYSNSDMPFTKTLPVQLSEDGKTISIDLRGMSNDPNSLTGGYQFVDDNGNPTSAPTTISISITGLNAVGGGGLCDLLTSPDGLTKVAQYGKLWRTYNFKDLTFATPKLVTAQFYDSAAPEAKSDAILSSSNTMDLTVDGDKVIESADVVFTAGEVNETVASAGVARNNGVWTVALPASVKAAGSSALVVSLANVVYNVEDGVNHVIEPLDVAKNGGAVKQVATVAEIKALDNGIEFLLSTETLKVTLVDAGQGLATVEDETGGLTLDPSATIPFTEGKLVKGTIAGTYLGSSMISVNSAKSSFTDEDTDLSTGLVVDELSQLVNNDNVYRLLTVNASDDITLVYDEDQEGVVIGEMISTYDVLGRLPQGYTYPENIGQVTGVYYTLGDQSVIILRSTDDIVAGTPEYNSIAEIKALPEGTEAILVLNNAKVNHQMPGYNFIEDETGAIIVPELTLSQRGKSLTGKIKGIAMPSMNAFYAEDESYVTIDSEEDVDVTKGLKLTAADLADPAHHYRLVSFSVEDGHTLVGDNDMGMIIIDNGIYVYDMFEALGQNYTFPTEIHTVTGIVYPMNIMGMDDLMEYTPAQVMIVPRNADDIMDYVTAGVQGIHVNGTTEGDVYNVMGVKVRNAGDSLNDLPTGVYIINGKKVLIRK